MKRSEQISSSESCCRHRRAKQKSSFVYQNLDKITSFFLLTFRFDIAHDISFYRILIYAFIENKPFTHCFSQLIASCLSDNAKLCFTLFVCAHAYRPSSTTRIKSNLSLPNRNCCFIREPATNKNSIIRTNRALITVAHTFH